MYWFSKGSFFLSSLTCNSNLKHNLGKENEPSICPLHRTLWLCAEGPWESRWPNLPERKNCNCANHDRRAYAHGEKWAEQGLHFSDTVQILKGIHQRRNERQRKVEQNYSVCSRIRENSYSLVMDMCSGSVIKVYEPVCGCLEVELGATRQILALMLW